MKRRVKTETKFKRNFIAKEIQVEVRGYAAFALKDLFLATAFVFGLAEAFKLFCRRAVMSTTLVVGFRFGIFTLMGLPLSFFSIS